MRQIFSLVRMPAVVLALGMPLVLSDAPCSGAWVSAETWETYALNDDPTAHTQWKKNVANTSGKIVADPAGGTNKVLQMTSSGVTADNDKGYYLSLGSNALPANAVSTLFFRVRTDGGGIAARLTDQGTISAANWYDYDRTSTAATGSGTPRISPPNTTSGDVTGNTWYNVWVVVDLTTTNFGKFSQYISTGSNPAVLTASDQALSAWGSSVGASTPTGALQTFMLMPINAASHSGNRRIYIDDIYVDKGGSNFINPVPEPSFVAMLGFGSLYYLRRRNRRSPDDADDV